MADQTDWQALNARCEANGAFLCLRIETPKPGDVRLAVSAKQKAYPNKLVQDLRRNLDDNAPQFAITQMVTQALAEWWPA